jgi:hypothetical protein
MTLLDVCVPPRLLVPGLRRLICSGSGHRSYLLSVATGTVSAGTAAAYIEGEWVGMPFKNLVLGLLILIGAPPRLSFRSSTTSLIPLILPTVFTGLLLFGVKDSTRLTLSICLFHVRPLLAAYASPLNRPLTTKTSNAAGHDGAPHRARLGDAHLDRPVGAEAQLDI